MRIAAASDIGPRRPTNQDLYWHDQRLLVVADGMGGHAGGEVAAQVAIDTVKNWVYPSPDLSEERLKEAVTQAMVAANEEVYDRAERESALRGMGTTLTMALIAGACAVVGHVGDSRAYLFRDGSLVQLTTDHSVTNELVRIGGLTESEALAHPYRNLLTRALGAERHVEVDVETLRLRPGDALMLCTDGLTNVLDDREIARTLTEHADPQRAVDLLVTHANQRGGSDNVTVVLARFEDEFE